MMNIKKHTKKFVYIWEYGSSLGHLMTFFPIAKQLQKQGWTGVFFIPEKSINIDSCQKILKENHFAFFSNPYSRMAMSKPNSVDGHVDILTSLDCFRDELSLEYHLKAWISVLDECQPDIVFGDFAPVAILAARMLNIHSSVIDTGYFYPPPDQLPPLFSQHDAQDSEQLLEEKTIALRQKEIDLVGRINKTLAKFSSSFRLKSFLDIYRCSKLFIFNYPELTPFYRESERYCLGTVIAPPQSTSIKKRLWKNNAISRPKVFAYLHLENKVALQILKTLNAKTELDIMVYAPQTSLNLTQTAFNDHLLFTDKPVDLNTVLQTCDLVICHAGVGLITQSLWAGKPLLLAPFHHEQKLNAINVVKLGCGKSLHYQGSEPNVIHHTIDHLLNHPIYTAKARSFKLTHEPLCIDTVVNQVENTLLDNQSPRLSFTSQQLKVNRLSSSIKTNQLEVVFLSYDEPNADENWQHTLKHCPHAKRVHGVKGLDAAHKAAADAVEGERFLLIDGDNKIDPSFFNLDLSIPLNKEQATTLQWCSKNSINGLKYAGGGVKIWRRCDLQRLQSHESLPQDDKPLSLDFWEQPGYFVFKNVYSVTEIHASAYQAFRAGFREGVKYSHSALESLLAQKKIKGHQNLLRRLGIWASVGLDSDNGIWAMIGARMGLLHVHKVHRGDTALSLINHYDWLGAQWEQLASKLLSKDVFFTTNGGRSHTPLASEAATDFWKSLGEQINAMTDAVDILDMTVQESINFKNSMAIIYGSNEAVFSPLHNGGSL
ncbi:MAG: glycosyltransferase [Pseudomonadota bacterium]